MTISVDWPTREIFIPQADLTPVAAGEFDFDLNAFRLELKDLEDGEGMPFPDTHRHSTTVTISGVTLARVVEIINGYFVTFEAGNYAVNLIGANSNIADVATVNGVSIRSQNSAGLIQVASGSGLNAEQATQLQQLWATLESAGVFSAAALASSPASSGGFTTDDRATLNSTAAAVALLPDSDAIADAANADQIIDIWQILGLDAANPLQVSDTSRTAGNIAQQIADNGSITTVTRQ